MQASRTVLQTRGVSYVAALQPHRHNPSSQPSSIVCRAAATEPREETVAPADSSSQGSAPSLQRSAPSPRAKERGDVGARAPTPLLRFPRNGDITVFVDSIMTEYEESVLITKIYRGVLELDKLEGTPGQQPARSRAGSVVVKCVGDHAFYKAMTVLSRVRSLSLAEGKGGLKVFMQTESFSVGVPRLFLLTVGLQDPRALLRDKPRPHRVGHRTDAENLASTVQSSLSSGSCITFSAVGAPNLYRVAKALYAFQDREEGLLRRAAGPGPTTSDSRPQLTRIMLVPVVTELTFRRGAAANGAPEKQQHQRPSHAVAEGEGEAVPESDADDDSRATAATGKGDVQQGKHADSAPWVVAPAVLLHVVPSMPRRDPIAAAAVNDSTTKVSLSEYTRLKEQLSQMASQHEQLQELWRKRQQ